MRRIPLVTLHAGDNRQVLKTYPDNHFDSCVCDPPYELGFMGKKWDQSGIAYDVSLWQEVYRVLKPGAHLLAFGGSRTYHRLACAIEDAGFEIRDRILYLTEGGRLEVHYPVWLYGSGFPKSLDVSKAMDQAAGAERNEKIWIDRYKDGGTRQNLGPVGNLWPHANGNETTAPATDLARQWQGWGTALKPAHEPICVARKPFKGTVVHNVTKWGCGGLNVAGAMIPIKPGDIGDRIDGPNRVCRGTDIWCNDDGSFDLPRNYQEPAGRWPANVIHDGSEEMLAEFQKFGSRSNNVFGLESRVSGTWQPGYAGTGSAARFFYCAKASPEERNRGLEGCQTKPIPYAEYRPNLDSTKSYVSEYADGSLRPMNKQKNSHPTVKPLALMCYLVRLVTPPGGIVLDHFCGSGSTLIAAAKEGFDSVGIDLDPENCDLSERRCRGHLGILVEVKINP